MEQLCKITYISNAGVMIEFYDRKVLIDGLCSSKIPIYKGPPAEVKEQIIRGTVPYAGIDMMLFTHNHTDHFDPQSAAEFLKYNTGTVVISTKETIDQINIRANKQENTKLISVNPDLYSREKIEVKGIDVKAISLIHDGKDYEDVKNLAYLINIDGKKVLHVGDAKSVEENYLNLNLANEKIDLLIVPFPYVSIPRGRQVVEKYIKPRKIAVVHLPYRELDRFGWIDATKKSYMRVQKDFIQTTFFEDIGDSLYI